MAEAQSLNEQRVVAALGLGGDPPPPRQFVDARGECLLPKKEAAALLNTSVATLDRWAARGKGPPRLNFGTRMTRYPLGLLRKWLEKETLRALGSDCIHITSKEEQEA